MRKDKVTAGIFALLFGGFGVHRFYLGQVGLGILYCIFFMTMIPFFIGFIDGIVLLTMDNDAFDAKYNSKYAFTRKYQYGRSRQKHQQYQGYQGYQGQPTEFNNNPKPVRKSNPFKDSAIAKYKNYDFEGAIVDFKKSLRVHPVDPVTHFNLACAYSLTEQVKEGYFHLAKAVEVGYVDFNKIQTDGDLAYLRIQDEWEDFVKNGYKVQDDPLKIEAPEGKPLDEVITKIEKLGELKEKGLLSEEEFQVQKEKLLKNL